MASPSLMPQPSGHYQRVAYCLVVPVQSLEQQTSFRLYKATIQVLNWRAQRNADHIRPLGQ